METLSSVPKVRETESLEMSEIRKSAILFDGSPKFNDAINFSIEKDSVSSNDDERSNSIPRRRNHETQHQQERKATGMTRRCVCNLSQCASTNYMCKSERQTLQDGTEVEPGCFVEELDSVTGTDSSRSGGGLQGIVTESNGRVTTARRGCIEMLSREKQRLCRNEAGDPIQCCFNEDMCNYHSTFYPPVTTFHQQNANVPVNRVPFEAAGGRMNANLDHQVWLRAAVIAVPVCGLMILIVLIYVARKLLNAEDERKETFPEESNFYSAHERRQKLEELLLPNSPPLLDSYEPTYHCHRCSRSSGPAAYLLPSTGTDPNQYTDMPQLTYYPATHQSSAYIEPDSHLETLGQNNSANSNRTYKFKCLNWNFMKERNTGRDSSAYAARHV